MPLHMTHHLPLRWSEVQDFALMSDCLTLLVSVGSPGNHSDYAEQ